MLNRTRTQVFHVAMVALAGLALFAAQSQTAPGPAGFEVEVAATAAYEKIPAAAPVKIVYAFWDTGAVARSYFMDGKNRHYSLKQPGVGEVSFYEKGSVKSTVPLRASWRGFRTAAELDKMAAVPGASRSTGKILGRPAILMKLDRTDAEGRDILEQGYIELFPGRWYAVSGYRKTVMANGVVFQEMREVPSSIIPIDDSALKAHVGRPEAPPSVVIDNARAAIGLGACPDCLVRDMHDGDKTTARLKPKQ